MRKKYQEAPEINQAFLQKYLDYDPVTGEVRRTVTIGRAKAGSLVETNSKGYLVIKIYYRLYKLHRVIWMWQTGTWPMPTVDHINQIKTDNRWCNLREADHRTQMYNQTRKLFHIVPHSNSKSGHVGVQWHKATRKWEAKIGHDNESFHLGVHSTIEEAINARKKAKHKLIVTGKLW